MITEQELDVCESWAMDHCKVQNPSKGKPIPMRPNKIQRDFKKKSVALRLSGKGDVCVKPRQAGMSTYLLCMVLAIAVNIPGTNIVWIGSSEKNHKAIKRKFKIVYNSALASPGSGLAELKQTNNVDELTLVNGSSIVFMWAGQTIESAKDTGRGDTIHLIVCSEAAFWTNAEESYRAIRPAIQHAGPSIIWESTTNGTRGQGSLFYRKAMDAFHKRSMDTLHFWEWYWVATYRLQCNREEIVKTYTEDEKMLVESKGLDPEQIAWRRYMIIDLGGEGEFFEAYPELFSEAFVIAGKCIFNTLVMRRAALHLSKHGRPRVATPDLFMKIPDTVAFAALVRGEESADGYLRFYREKQPRKRYFIGVDSSQGVDGGDWLCVSVIGEDAKYYAMLWCLIHPIHVAWITQLLAIYYNETEHVGIEDKSTGPEIWRYLTTELGDREISEHRAHPILALFQAANLVPNNVGTRPILINTLIQHINCGAMDIPDEETLHEAKSLKVNKDGKIEASPGEHDDRMMSGAVSLWVREEILPRYESNSILAVNINDKKTPQDKYAYIDTTRKYEDDRARGEVQRNAQRNDDSESGRYETGSVWDLL